MKDYGFFRAALLFPIGNSKPFGKDFSQGSLQSNEERKRQFDIAYMSTIVMMYSLFDT